MKNIPTSTIAMIEKILKDFLDNLKLDITEIKNKIINTIRLINNETKYNPEEWNSETTIHKLDIIDNELNLIWFKIQNDNPMINSKNGAKRPCSGNSPDIEPTTCVDLLGTKKRAFIFVNDE